MSAQRVRASSPFAQRVASRPMSWFDPAQQGHACAGSADSISETTPRISSASRFAWVSMNANARSSWSPSPK